MYADKITDSMRQTIEETERRRSLQLAYNEKHGITPQAIIKARNKIIGLDKDEDQAATQAGKLRAHRLDISKTPTYAEEFSRTVDIAADPVIPYMNKSELQRSINRMRADMVAAAKQMDFLEAARLRDEVVKLEERLKTLEEE